MADGVQVVQAQTLTANQQRVLLYLLTHPGASYTVLAPTDDDSAAEVGVLVGRGLLSVLALEPMADDASGRPGIRFRGVMLTAAGLDLAETVQVAYRNEAKANG